jgi:radical SAM superfamily enzyme YgiQ (UPF0313 family)
MKIRVLLINVPAASVQQQPEEIEYWKWHYALKSKLTYPNLNEKQLKLLGNIENQNVGLLSIASALLENNHDAAYLAPSVDFNGEHRVQDFLKKILEKIGEYEPHYIGLSATTCSINNAMEYSARIKEYRPKVKTIIGGAHANGCRGKDLEELVNHFDYVIRGFGEKLILNLVNGNVNSRGISFKKNSKIIINPISYSQLPGYPRAANELLNISEMPAVRVFTSLGCRTGAKCIFCADINNYRIKEIPEETIIDEVRYFSGVLGSRYFYLGDENFFFNKQRAFKILNLINTINPDIILGFQARIENANEDIISNAVEHCSCTEIQYGVESASQRILDTSNKGLEVNQVKEICDLTKSYGISTHCYFMVGLPGETQETAELTINMIEDLLKNRSLDMVEYKCVVPFPGTRMWEWHDKYLIKIKNRDWSQFRGENKPSFDLATLNSEEIYNIYLDSLRRIAKLYKERYMRDFGHEFKDINFLSAVNEGCF